MRVQLIAWVISLVFLPLAFAQKEDMSNNGPRLNEGRLFAVKFTPASKVVEVSLAGTPSAVLGPDRIEVFGREIRGGKVQKLTIKPSGQAFEIVEHLEEQVPVEIDIHDKTNRKKETFKFDLGKKP